MPSARPESDGLWKEYLEATAERGARPLLERALTACDGRGPGQALDLGCGSGGDTLELLRRGHRVLAVDALPEAVAHTQRRAREAGLAAGLETRVARFEELTLEPVSRDLVVAFFSLPFCPRERFDALWDSVVAALRPGGLLACQLFGDRDEWLDDPEHPASTFLSRVEVEARLHGLETLHLEEEEERRPMAIGGDKDWHLYHVLARRPPATG